MKLANLFKEKNMSEYMYLGEVERIVYPLGLEEAGGVIHHDKLYIKRTNYFEHVLMQGGTGKGKTTFEEVQIEEAIKAGFKVVVVDGAGNLNLAKRVCMIARKHGVKDSLLVAFGQSYTGNNRPSTSVFNGFIGSGFAICARLIALLGLYDMGTDADYYRGARRNIISFMCGVNTYIEFPGTDYFEPPRSFQDIKKRLDPVELKKYFKGNDDALKFIDDHAAEMKALRDLVAERCRPFLHLLDERGFKLGDHQVTIFSIDTINGGQPATYLYQFLGEAFKEAMGTIGQTIWFIDEAGAFGGRMVSEFTRQARQKELGIVLAFQSMASFRDATYGDRYIEELLDTTNLKIVMNNESAESMRERAGTRKEKDVRHQKDKSGSSKGESVGFRDNDKITPEMMRNLPKGGAFVCLGNAVVQIRPKPVVLDFEFDESMENRDYREDRLLKPPSKDSSTSVDKPTDDPFKGT
jgi:hypothetical protein